MAIHRNQFTVAQQHIDKTREVLDAELTALVGESYNRAYKYVVGCTPSHTWTTRPRRLTPVTDAVPGLPSLLRCGGRVGSAIVRVQMLAELEEIVRYKQVEGDAEAQQLIRTTWNRRCVGGRIPHGRETKGGGEETSPG